MRLPGGVSVWKTVAPGRNRAQEFDGAAANRAAVTLRATIVLALATLAVLSAAPVDAAPPAADPGGCFPLPGRYYIVAGRSDSKHHPPLTQDIWAPEGTPVLAPLSGVVVGRGYEPRGAGLYVRVHARSGEYALLHLRPRSIIVTRGRPVRAGDFVAQVGHTGSAGAPALGIGLWTEVGGASSARPVDPLPALIRWRKRQC
jgi:murein DD-endopeptidase MepM/ murein hydrolase activator NlpD